MFLGDPPLVGSPLGPGLFLCLSLCLLQTSSLNLYYPCSFLMELNKTFWRHSLGVFTLDPNSFEFLVCLSVCLVAYFLTEIRQILGYLQFLIRYLFDFFGRHSRDAFTLLPNKYKLFVCLSVWQLAFFLTEIRQMQGYIQFLDIYLSEFFWRHSPEVFTLYAKAYKFFVCLSVCQLANFLAKIR